MAKKRDSRIQGRSSISGKFVPKSYTKAHPDTTENERLKIGRRKPKK